MSFDESELLDDLAWIEKLDENSSVTEGEYCCVPATPRYEKRAEYIDNVQLVSWWEFYSNESNLSEWDGEDVRYYDEETDEFGKWASNHCLNFESISLLRSLRLDDMDTLTSLKGHQLDFLRACDGYDDKLKSALNDLTRGSAHCNAAELDDDTFYEGNLIIDEKEFNLRPRLTRNLPSRRSTRSTKNTARAVGKPSLAVRTDGIRTIGPGATRKKNGYTENRRLSWETFSTYSNNNNNNQRPQQQQQQHGHKSKHSGDARGDDKIFGTANISTPIFETFKFPSESQKKDKQSGKKTKTLFPHLSPS